MSTIRMRRRSFSVLIAGALAVAGLSFASPAQAAPASTTGSGPSYVDDATFTWGLNGYAQKGIFGAWTFKDLEGNVTLLDGASQTEYSTAPIPATSFPADAAKPKANAVKFTQGVGSIDKSTGAGKLSWTGKYVVNAYPASFNAPNETYEDPVLTVAADGSGTLTVKFSIGAGIGQDNEPFPAQDFGRLTLLTFDAGSLSAKSDTGYRVTPDYQNVDNGLSGQTKTCTTAGGATGWWGSWPQPFITALNSHASGQSVLPHFYSTGCGGNQDWKPALPFDVKYNVKPLPKVTVSETQLNPNGSQTITVTGENFHLPLSLGTRPPLNNQPTGTYVGFGKFAENWRPSQGAPSSNRKTAENNVGLKWAVPEASYGGPGLGAANGAIPLSANGSFTAELTIDKAALDASAGASAESFRYGIYTYPGSGGVAPAYETYTPLVFQEDEEPTDPEPEDSTVTVIGPASVPYAAAATFEATVTGGTGTGTVTLSGVGADQTANVVNKKATFTVPKTQTPGPRMLTFAYSGDDDTKPSSATKQVVWAKAATQTRAGWHEKPTRTKGGTVIVRVYPQKPALAGNVKFTMWQKSNPSRVYTGGTKKLYSSQTWFALPKNLRGEWVFRVTFQGSTTHGTSTYAWGYNFR